MLKACIFGDRFLAAAFTKAVRHEIVRQVIYEQRLYYEMISYAVENLVAEDSLLRMMVDVMFKDHFPAWDPAEQVEAREMVPRSFLFEVMDKYVETISTGKDPNALDECDYHDHTSKAERRACQELANEDNLDEQEQIKVRSYRAKWRMDAEYGLYEHHIARCQAQLTGTLCGISHQNFLPPPQAVSQNANTHFKTHSQNIVPSHLPSKCW